MDPYVLARPKEILLVEDSSTDAQMVLRAMSMNDRRKTVITSVDGEGAMSYLRRKEEGLKPDLILLDLMLPKKDGWEVLAECKADPQLRYIPIVVFTTSKLGSEVKRCYDLGANSFVAKPFDLESFQHTIDAIVNYWLGVAAPPL
jgi:chemotaxis family two-component system response regulator Rcp1